MRKSTHLALLYSDRSITCFAPGTKIEAAREEALRCDKNEDDPSRFTSLVEVNVHVIRTIEVRARHAALGVALGDLQAKMLDAIERGDLAQAQRLAKEIKNVSQ
jgi:hypothetical protein